MSSDDRPHDRSNLRADSKTRHRVDVLLSLLVEQRRRDLLYYVASAEVTDVETLTRELAAKSEGVPVDDVSDEVREEIHVHLVHTDLPKLADASAIEFDRRSGAVRCRELPPMLEHFVATCRDIELDEPNENIK